MLFTETITDSKGRQIFVCNDTYLLHYVQKGGTIINMTYNNIENGTDIEKDIKDIDCYTWSSPINTMQELENTVN